MVDTHAIYRYIERYQKKRIPFMEVTARQYNYAREGLLAMMKRGTRIDDTHIKCDNYIIVYEGRTIRTIYEIR